ncbi:MAG: protein kinase [Planctomycetes bacterium]|nr:protein kinase [Planctomycetota bacterium]
MHLGSSLSAGQLVGGCRVVRLLGRGGMGEVYLAEHVALQRPVALKILPPDLENTQRVERFLKEARTCSRIEHPNVVVIHDVGEQDGLYYIVMQYVQGKNLTELIRDHGGPLPWRSAVRLIQLTARGLHAVHSRSLVHRDVKPSNIMLSVDSRVVLMDFGLVREELDSSLTQAGQVVGTPSFMSPEQCRGKALDRRSDVFSLGSTLYCLLTGDPPFRGPFQEVVLQVAGGGRPESVQLLNNDVPRQLSRAVDKAMALRPEDRFQTADAVGRELKKLLQASQLDSTTAWRTAPAAETQPVIEAELVPELPQMELLPLDTTWEAVERKLPWIGAGAGTLAGLLLLGLLLKSLFSVSEPPPIALPPSVTSPPPNMVRIEAGFVQLGNDEAKLRTCLSSLVEADELDKVVNMLADVPQQRVRMPVFHIDKYEVTNGEYAIFLKQTNRTPPEHWGGTDPPMGRADHPAVNVSHDDAEAYATWAGKQLPTREQWVRAYRGDRDWLFPWGDDYDATRANVKGNPNYPSTCPVHDTPRDVSPFGVCNLVGNASEFIRGTAFRKGRTWRMAKGAEYRTYGFVFGIAPGEAFYRPLDHKDQGLGFRCIWEEPQYILPQSQNAIQGDP